VAKKSQKKTARKKTTSSASPKKKTRKKAVSPSRAKSSGSKKSTGSASAKKTAKKAAKKTTKKAAASKKTASAKKQSSAPAARKNKAGLSKAQLKSFREALIEKRKDLLGDMYGSDTDTRFADGGQGERANLPTHPADAGTDSYEQEFTLGLLESERILLDEIQQALERIENGTFGICMGTGEPIGLPRLKARPWAKYCIDYARKIEKGLVRRDEDDIDPFADENDDEDEDDLEGEDIDSADDESDEDDED
jgi:RNA polymerase-binding protein DksA